MSTVSHSQRIYSSILIFCLAILSGCSSLMHSINPKGHASELVLNAKWHETRLQTPTFTLWAAHNTFTAGEPLTIYLEGDGRVSSSYDMPSGDPSSPEPLALKLAVQQKTGNIAYLARPCHYMVDEDKHCETKYWTTARYHPHVIQATVNGIMQLQHKANTNDIRLVGHSGGGGLAVLVAPEIPQLSQITTLAGNLSLQAMEDYHKSLPLVGSIDPISTAKANRNILQHHYSGTKDTVVPLSIADIYVQTAASDKVTQIIVEGVDHWGWEKIGTWSLN